MAPGAAYELVKQPLYGISTADAKRSKTIGRPRFVIAYTLQKQAPIETRPLHRTELPTPVPSDDELLIRIRACGICRTDLHVVEGDLALKKSPVIPGHQVIGEVAQCGTKTRVFVVGQRVGVAWLHRTCGICRFCRVGRENLCDSPLFTGWTADGGFSEFIKAPEAFCYALPDGFSDLQAAPLLCAGIIGYRALRLTGLGSLARPWKGARLGIYGFGAAGHVALQVARSRGAVVYVCTRDRERHQALAEELGAEWVGSALDIPPQKLDAGIIFAPAGEIVPAALQALDKGGVLALGGIHMSPTPPLDYSLLYHERTIQSVANNTRDDGREFLLEAARIPVRTHTQCFDFDTVNDALIALKHDAIKGAGVVLIRQ